MRGTFKLTAVIAVAVVALTATVASAQSNVDAAPLIGQAGPGGVVTLAGQVDVAEGWTEILQVKLPPQATYLLDADVRGYLEGTPSVNTHIIARLWSDELKGPIPDSERMVLQLMDLNVGDKATGDNETAPISSLFKVTGRADTVTLQARWDDRFTSDSPVISRIISDGSGRTSLRWVQL
jgi:hypothetical protein